MTNMHLQEPSLSRYARKHSPSLYEKNSEVERKRGLHHPLMDPLFALLNSVTPLRNKRVVFKNKEEPTPSLQADVSPSREEKREQLSERRQTLFFRSIIISFLLFVIFTPILLISL